ncbi:MAG: hypothetical protein U5K54_19545 [Cytophagales bacterium]|nr:hypothetical protein [Cytophagales bacterium]
MRGAATQFTSGAIASSVFRKLQVTAVDSGIVAPATLAGVTNGLDGYIMQYTRPCT